MISEYEESAYELALYHLIVDIDKSFDGCFPNIKIELQIYLSLMVTNCSGERSFSKLKRIINEIRSNMDQARSYFNELR